MKVATAQILAGVILGAILFTGYNVGMPVHLGMKAEQWQITQDTIAAEVSGYKIRSCDYIQGTAIGYVQKNGTISEVPFSVNANLEHSPKSIQYRISFGNWRWITSSKESLKVQATLKYQCGTSIVSETIGPFEVPKVN